MILTQYYRRWVHASRSVLLCVIAMRQYFSGMTKKKVKTLWVVMLFQKS